MIKILVKYGFMLAAIATFCSVNYAQTPPVTGKYWSVVVDTKAVSVAKATATLAGVFRVGTTTSAANINFILDAEGKIQKITSIKWLDGSISTTASSGGGSGWSGTATSALNMGNYSIYTSTGIGFSDGSYLTSAGGLWEIDALNGGYQPVAIGTTRTDPYWELDGGTGIRPK